MFRPMLRPKQALSQEECIEILKTEPRGVLSLLGDEGYPYGLPMDHWYCEEDGKLYFHCGKTGHKLDAIAQHGKASFCVYDQGRRKEGDWALHFRSVIVFGRLQVIRDPVRVIDITRKLSYKYTSDAQYIENEISQYGAGTLCLELTIEHISGKRVKES